MCVCLHASIHTSSQLPQTGNSCHSLYQHPLLCLTVGSLPYASKDALSWTMYTHFEIATAAAPTTGQNTVIKHVVATQLTRSRPSLAAYMVPTRLRPKVLLYGATGSATALRCCSSICIKQGGDKPEHRVSCSMAASCMQTTQGMCLTLQARVSQWGYQIHPSVAVPNST